MLRGIISKFKLVYDLATQGSKNELCLIEPKMKDSAVSENREFKKLRRQLQGKRHI